jgi:hypothetical protein
VQRKGRADLLHVWISQATKSGEDNVSAHVTWKRKSGTSLDAFP